MKNWLKVIFRRRLRGLLVVQRGNIHQFADEVARKAHNDCLRQYLMDQGMVMLVVRDVEAVKAIQLGPDTRLLVTRDKIKSSVLERIAKSGPGDMVMVNEDEMDQIRTL
jgi:hypothetical protein